MPVKLVLIDSATGQALDTHIGMDGHVTLVAESYARLHGSFKTGTYSNETATVVTPLTDGAIQITDLIITSGKKIGGFATVNFTDGSNTVIIVKAEADYGIQLAVPFQGHWQGWKDAYIQVVVSAVFDVTIAVGYVKLPKEITMNYAEWNALR